MYTYGVCLSTVQWEIFEWCKFSNACSVFENKNWENLNSSQLQCEMLTMSLYSCFAEASKWSDLPNPNGLLSPSVIPAAIKEANEVVQSVTSEGKS